MILVTGGTGFVGSHLLKRLSTENIHTRCLVRSVARAERLRELGMEIASGDLNNSGSLKKVATGVDTVIHLVGIIVEKKGATFETIHAQGTRALVDACKEAGVRRFIYISALGTRENARSRYHITKLKAEQAVINSGMEYVILRPSIMYGEGGEFITLLSKVVRQAPVIPIIDGSSKVQPIYVGNTVDCMIKSLNEPRTTNRIFEIAGPEQITYNELFHILMEVLNIKKPAVEIPVWLMWPVAYVLERVMEEPPITTQQLIMLQEDNICDISKMQEIFDLELVPFKEGLKKFIAPQAVS